MPHTSDSEVLQQHGAGGQVGTRKLAELDRLPRRGHDRGENAGAHAVYVILERMLIQTVSAMWLVASLAAPAAAAGDRPTRRRRRGATSSASRSRSSSSSRTAFDDHPLADLLGAAGRRSPPAVVPVPDARSADARQRARVRQARDRHRRDRLSVRLERRGRRSPIRGSIESVPTIRARVHRAGAGADLRADQRPRHRLGVGLDMSDRSPGWGLGATRSSSAVSAGSQTDQMDGTRYFGEGGGGIMSGPFGVDLSVKFTVNRFIDAGRPQHLHDPDLRARHAHLLSSWTLLPGSRAPAPTRSRAGFPN